jgi:tungstate transport system substrate-binding protein
MTGMQVSDTGSLERTLSIGAALLRVLHWIVIFAALSVTACRNEQEAPPVVLATTTSVANSGLLDHLMPGFRSPVRITAVGSGAALQLLTNGAADVAITHAPEAERAALSRHPEWSYRKLCWNEFVIVGPRDDPAKLASATDAVSAMRRIVTSHARFISRGDDSGTAERERQLWALAGKEPDRSRLVIAGASMGQTLRIAGSVGGYTVTDEGTFAALRGIVALEVLYRGDPLLVNTYAVIADPSRASGVEFADWLDEGTGHSLLRESITKRLVRGFELWPDGRPRNQPSDLPR